MSNSLWLPWTVAHQAPLSMEFPRPEYRSGLLFPSPGNLPTSGMEPTSPASQVNSLPLSHLGSPPPCCVMKSKVQVALHIQGCLMCRYRQLTVCTTSSAISILRNIHRFWHPQGSWNQTPPVTKKWLYLTSLCVRFLSVKLGPDSWTCWKDSIK